MKKILIFCVVLAMLLFAGCNGDPKPTEPAVPGVEDSLFDQDGEDTATGGSTQGGDEVNNNDANQGGETDQTQSTIPTGPQKVEENTDPAQPEDQLPTVPEVPETIEPVQPDVTEPTAPETEVDTTNLTYAQFHELTGIQQQEIMESFESIEAFFLWYDQAKAEHEKENPPIEIEDGQIDLEKIPGGN